MGDGQFSKQETEDKTIISSNCGSEVVTAILPVQIPN